MGAPTDEGEFASDDAVEERGPLRTCIATRTVHPHGEMLRFVVAPDGSIVPDLKRNLPGRGVWVTATVAHVRQAVRRKAFARGFRKGVAVTVAAELPEVLDGLLEKAALQALSLANKAGAAVSGSGKVEDALAAGRVGVLVHATDARPDGIRKIDQAMHRSSRLAGGDATRQLGNAGIDKVELFTSDQLSLALGRAHVIHAAVNAGGACQAFLAHCRRLSLYRSDAGSGVPTDSADKGMTAGKVAPQSDVGEAKRAQPWDLNTHERYEEQQ